MQGEIEKGGAGKVHYVGKPMPAGMTFWRLVIRDHQIGNTAKPCVEYQWLDEEGGWRPWKSFPDDIPRSLSYLIEQEQPVVDWIIHGQGNAEQLLLDI